MEDIEVANRAREIFYVTVEEDIETGFLLRREVIKKDM